MASGPIPTAPTAWHVLALASGAPAINSSGGEGGEGVGGERVSTQSAYVMCVLIVFLGC